ncbi:hypothetical protein QQP08_003886 [Theobroma cacao]|nr:hypothetical protein QQP08_003886 [Theobroma cacao]
MMMTYMLLTDFTDIEVIASIAVFSLSSSAPAIIVVSSRVNSPPLPACVRVRMRYFAASKGREGRCLKRFMVKDLIIPHYHANQQVFSTQHGGKELHALSPGEGLIANKTEAVVSTFVGASTITTQI